MRGLKRIALIVFVLIGGVSFFGYWSINQFDQVFDNLSTAYLADVPPAYLSLKKTNLASTSTEMSGEFATSTDSELVSTSPKISTELITSIDPELTFTFPQKDTRVYIGCTYSISWQASGRVALMEAALVDAGTREAVGPKTSGIPKENIIAKDLQKLDWKVGSVWPGAYYIKISKINDFDIETRSKVFIINKIPGNIGADEQKDICKE